MSKEKLTDGVLNIVDKYDYSAGDENVRRNLQKELSHVFGETEVVNTESGVEVYTKTEKGLSVKIEIQRFSSDFGDF